MSAARERAGRALYYERKRGTNDPRGPLPWEHRTRQWRDEDIQNASAAVAASLDENDAALVEAVAASLTAGDYDRFSDRGKKVMRQSAQRAIIAARRHITGEGA